MDVADAVVKQLHRFGGMTAAQVVAVAENYTGETTTVEEVTAAVGGRAVWVNGTYCAAEEVEICTAGGKALSRRARVFYRQHAARLQAAIRRAPATGPRMATDDDFDSDGRPVGGGCLDGNTFIATDGTPGPPGGRAAARARWAAVWAAAV